VLPVAERQNVMAITSVRAKIWHSASRQNQRGTMSSFTYTLGALVAAIGISWIANYLETVGAGTLRFLTRTSSGRWSQCGVRGDQCRHEWWMQT
jgi:hypothetical protein